MKSIPSLLKLEWLKYKDNLVFKTIMVIFTIGFPLLILLGKRILRDAGPPIPSANTLYEFPTVWDYQGYIGNWMVSILLGFLVIYLFTFEVSSKTMRQNIITGLTRKEYFLSKIASIVMLSIYATLLYYVSCLILGFTHSDLYDFELVFDNNFAGIRFFLMSFGYLTFALLVSNLVKRGILSILIYVTYIMVVETVIRWIIFFKFNTQVANFAPLNSIEDVMPNPLMRISTLIPVKEFKLDFLLSYTEAVSMTVIYIALFIWGSWALFNKKDL